MKPDFLGGFSTIDAFVADKVTRLAASGRTLREIYEMIVEQRDAVFCESRDGGHTNFMTYGDFDRRTRAFAAGLSSRLSNLEKGRIVGLSLPNGPDFLCVMWALARLGFRPLLLNTRLDRQTLDRLLTANQVAAVVSEEAPYAVPTVAPFLGEGEAEENWADEILLMSSGTGGEVKLCAYTGANLAAQILDSGRIIRKSPDMKGFYQGHLKQLVVLPLYHIFGLFAVYLWFAFFSRTFVFLNDLTPDTVLKTVRWHGITHIFCVPLFWNKVYTAALAEARKTGQEKKLQSALRLYDRLSGLPLPAKLFSRLAFSSVRAKMFGNSIRFTIAGGSAISRETLLFFNAIGYRLSNGYGMTEAGITSVELSRVPRTRISGSAGKPFASVFYKTEQGELFLRGETTAQRVFTSAGELEKPDGWLKTDDLAELKKGRLYLAGRKDDLVIGPDGENLNPTLIEASLSLPKNEGFALVSGPTLLIQLSPFADEATCAALRDAAQKDLSRLGLLGKVGLYLTVSPLLLPDDFKISRKRLAKRLARGELRPAGREAAQESRSELTDALIRLFAQALDREPEGISPQANFFFDLNGSSLDYFSLLSSLQDAYGFTLPDGQEAPATVEDFCLLLSGRDCA